MVNDSTTVTTMAPLLLLVVTRLGSVGRATDLCAAVIEKRDPLGFPVLHGIFPPLGRLNFVHGSNLVVLNSGLLLIFSLSNGLTEFALGSLTVAVFLTQPVLEVEEYGKILNRNNDTHTIRYKYLKSIWCYVLNSKLTEVDSNHDFWLIKYTYSFHIHAVFVLLITGYLLLYGEKILINQPEKIITPTTFVFLLGLVLLNGLAYLSFLWLLHAELVAVSGYPRVMKFSDEFLPMRE